MKKGMIVAVVLVSVILLSAFASASLGSFFKGIFGGKITGKVVDSSNSTTSYNTNITLVYGDVNQDGKFDMADLNTLTDMILMRIPMVQAGTQAFTAGDVNVDGKLDLGDVNLMVDKLLGRISFFPVEIAQANEVKEQVKCVFANSSEIQRCYTDNVKFQCSGVGVCIADVSGEKGQSLTWKSSCGGYSYTIMDGSNDYAEFTCTNNTQANETISPSNLSLQKSGCSGDTCLLYEGDATTFNYNGVSYTLKAVAISGEKSLIQLSINQDFYTLTEGTIQTLSDNVNQILVTDVLSSAKAGITNHAFIKFYPISNLTVILSNLTVSKSGCSGDTCLLYEGDATTFNYNGVSYTLKAVAISGEKSLIQLSINQDFYTLTEGTIQTLSDNVNQILVTDVLSSAKVGITNHAFIKFYPISNLTTIPSNSSLPPELANCAGCLYQNTCYPVTNRFDAYYCDVNKQIQKQVTANGNNTLACQNNYECASNVCLSSQCIAPSVINRILSWFKSLFGLG